MSRQVIEFAPELARLQGIAQNCECCVPPCCNYARLTAQFNVVASASVDNITNSASVRWNWNAAFVMQRADATNLPEDENPSNRTFSVTDILDECQITNNKPRLPDGTQDLWLVGRGSYRYEEKDDEDQITYEEKNDVQIYLVSIDANLDCEGKAPGLGGDVTPTRFTFLVEGLGSEIPNCPEFAAYSGNVTFITMQIDNFGSLRPHYGSVGRIENQCQGWDQASISETLIVNVFRGAAGAAPSVGEWMEEDAFHHDDAQWFDNRNWQDETDDPKGDQQR